MFWRREKDHETRSFSTIMKNEQIHLYHTWHGYQTTRLPLGTIQLHSRFGLIFTDRQACPCSCVPTQLGGCWQRRVTASVPVCFGRGSGSHMWMKLTKPNQWSLHKSSDVINGLIKCSLYIFFFFFYNVLFPNHIKTPMKSWHATMSHHDTVSKPSVVKRRGLLTIIPLAELLCYLGVVWASHDADLHFPPQSLEKLIQLWVYFLQITGKCMCMLSLCVKG